MSGRSAPHPAGAARAPGPARLLCALLSCVTVLLVGLLAGCSEPGSGPAGGGGSASAAPTSVPTSVSTSTPSWAEGMPVVTPDALPPEARRTLELIEADGPFPYDRDGAVFNNFERLLPERRRGHYHEYTVRTPGESDRGARRIVTGEDGELYYTDDHYLTFKAVLPR